MSPGTTSKYSAPVGFVSGEEAINSDAPITRIATLATCRNRKNKTLEALQSLYRQDLPQGVQVTNYIVDDGSSDGTSEAVRQSFPGVSIIQGAGDLYWAGGMRYGMQHILTKELPSFIFAYNDDVSLFVNAIKTLLEDYNRQSQRLKSSRIVISGSFVDPITKEWTYGGRRHKGRCFPLRFRPVEPSGTPVRVDTFGMNGVLIPYSIIEKNGFLSEVFRHRNADTDYGLRVQKNGGHNYIASRAIGYCANDHRKTPPGIGCLRKTLDIKGKPIIPTFHLHRRHGGPLWPIGFIWEYLRCLVKGARL